MLRSRSSAAEQSLEDQRLGGARPIASSRPAAPAGFTVEAIAAGFTAPGAVWLEADGMIRVLERGRPRRTPPRRFRVDPGTGTASLEAAWSWDTGDQLAGPAVAWPFAGAWLGDDGALYFCDPGPTSKAAEVQQFQPGAGIIWRVAPDLFMGRAPTGRVAIPAWAKRRPRLAGRPFSFLAGAAVLAAGLALVVYYRRSRPRRGATREC